MRAFLVSGDSIDDPSSLFGVVLAESAEAAAELLNVDLGKRIEDVERPEYLPSGALGGWFILTRRENYVNHTSAIPDPENDSDGQALKIWHREDIPLKLTHFELEDGTSGPTHLLIELPLVTSQNQVPVPT